MNLDLVGNPDLVSRNPAVAFETALWFWMTPQAAKPSCHDVITGRWAPGADDRRAGRLPGYGLLTNIINGGLECGKGQPTGGDNDRGLQEVLPDARSGGRWQPVLREPDAVRTRRLNRN